jgi:hypothetical protein
MLNANAYAGLLSVKKTAVDTYSVTFEVPPQLVGHCDKNNGLGQMNGSVKEGWHYECKVSILTEDELRYQNFRTSGRFDASFDVIPLFSFERYPSHVSDPRREVLSWGGVESFIYEPSAQYRFNYLGFRLQTACKVGNPSGIDCNPTSLMEATKVLGTTKMSIGTGWIKDYDSDSTHGPNCYPMACSTPDAQDDYPTPHAEGG